jgi:hypothetical protein
MPIDAANLYLTISNDIMLAWNAAWQRSDVPVLWRDNDPLPHPDPTFPRNAGTGGLNHWFRNEIDFGMEEVAEYGGGHERNIRVQYGSLLMRCFTTMMLDNEDEALALISDASRIFRGYRGIDANGCQLSFLESGTGLEWAPTDDGVWFMRGLLAVFEFRFRATS